MRVLFALGNDIELHFVRLQVSCFLLPEIVRTQLHHVICFSVVTTK